MRSLQNISYLSNVSSLLFTGKRNKQILITFQKALYFLILIFLPTQLGKHFWPDFSLILGQRIDYLSPTIYVTDVLLFLLFLLWSIQNVCVHIKERKIWQFSLIENYKNIIVGLLIVVFFTMNILHSHSIPESIYGLVKLSEMVFLTYYTNNILRKKLKIPILPLMFGIFSESILAICQFFTQASIGGIFYYFGEREFTSVTPGIANASINGQLLLRPYGTFSHPNVLAGYLVICMTILLNERMKIDNEKLHNALVFLTICFGTAGLLFTLGRVAMLVWFFVCMFLVFRYVQKRHITKKILLIANGILGISVVLLFVLTPLLPRFSQLRIQDESFVLREQLTEDAFRMMFAQPVLGVGQHNFLIALPHYDFERGSVFSLQPVHNIFLLIGAETGFIGLWVAISFVIWVYIRFLTQYRFSVGNGFKLFPSISLILLTEVVILGSFDHYFLTIQQGQFLLAVVLGICLSQIKKNNHIVFKK